LSNRCDDIVAASSELSNCCNDIVAASSKVHARSLKAATKAEKGKTSDKSKRVLETWGKVCKGASICEHNRQR
jgi:hypothetical protein